MADLVGKRLGQYEILSVLGQGGMAVVYKAHQESMDRDVAIKVIGGQLVDNADFVTRFQREAKLIAKLQHPHILPVYDFGKDEGLLFLAMRLVEGGSLDDRLRHGALPIDQGVRMFTQIASALSYAHDQGIVHRDLKPNNILLDTKGNPYLTDFGIAKMLEEGGAGGRLTATGTVMGTPSYMAPEQWRGENIDARTDIYALGVMLYEMLTGDLPFKGDTPYALMYKHFDALPPSARLLKPELPEAVSQVIQKALAKSQSERYASADLMAQDLNAALAGRAINASVAADNEPTFVGEMPIAPTKLPAPTDQRTKIKPAPGGKGAVPTESAAARPGRGMLPLIVAAVVVVLVVLGGIFLASRASANADANATATQVALNVIGSSTPLATATATITSTSTVTPTASATLTPTLTPTAVLPTAVRFEDYSDQEMNIKFRIPAGYQVQKKEGFGLLITQDFAALKFGSDGVVTGPPYIQVAVGNSTIFGSLDMAKAKTPMDALTAYFGTEQLANLDPVYGTHFPTATTTRNKPQLGMVRYLYMLMLGPDRFAIIMAQAAPDEIEQINKNIALALVRSVDFATTPTQAVIPTDTATPVVSATFVMPTKFEIYNSTVLGISLTYPTGWSLLESDGNILITSMPGFSATDVNSPPYIGIFSRAPKDIPYYAPEQSIMDLYRNDMGVMASDAVEVAGAPYPAVIGRTTGKGALKLNGWLALVQLDQDHYLEFYAQAPRASEEDYRDQVVIPMIKSLKYTPKK